MELLPWFCYQGTITMVLLSRYYSHVAMETRMVVYAYCLVFITCKDTWSCS